MVVKLVSSAPSQLFIVVNVNGDLLFMETEVEATNIYCKFAEHVDECF